MDIGSIAYLTLWLIVIAEGVAVIILARTFGAMILGTRDAIERDGLTLGNRAPEFEGVDPSGTQVASRDLLGDWLVLVFASPSCRICREMLPGLRQLARTLRGQVRLMILLRGSLEDARQFPLSDPLGILAIGYHGTAERYRVRVSPYVNVVDPEGRIRAKGLVNEPEHIEHLLSEAGLKHPIVLRHETHERPKEAHA